MFQSTRPMRGATRVLFYMGDIMLVSIHAPHAGRDDPTFYPVIYGAVSIHAPHAGRDS